MSEPFAPTRFADVNLVLGELLARLRALLGSRLQGMYLVGSLALGDFDPRSSDIDFVVLTDTDSADDLFGKLQDLHAQFAAGGSPWANSIEAVYVPYAALRQIAPGASHYPQIERGTQLFTAPLEDGWVFQCITLREQAVVLAGPDPRTLVDPVNPQDIRSAAAAIAGRWIEQAATDPAWLAWVRQRDSQVFVILTLCRMLYSLATGSVASKPRAAEWARKEFGGRWAALIERSLASQHEADDIAPAEVDETVAFIQFILEQGIEN
jgi:hypothetical protein